MTKTLEEIQEFNRRKIICAINGTENYQEALKLEYAEKKTTQYQFHFENMRVKTSRLIESYMLSDSVVIMMTFGSVKAIIVLWNLILKIYLGAYSSEHSKSNLKKLKGLYINY